ncbi:MAG TPA: quinone oxidoreductase [Burkholderiales bacterium]|nr:quinone oxidoreductase [Burkholderiales bacterium]
MPRINAVRVHRHGGPEELRYEAIEVGEPGPGEARVRHTAIGLNFTDIHHRTGRYPLPGLPHTIGMEAAGVVEAVGEGVAEVKPGDRVAYASDRPRAYSQATVMPAWRLLKLPDPIDDETAAALVLKGLTAQYLIRGAYPIKAGETILIHAAAGGVGLIMCQWARHLGVRVIGTVSTEEKAELAQRNGCEHPILYTREDVVARVRELTGGVGLPVVYDGVGASTFETSLQCLRRRGLVVSYGSASGVIPPFDLFRLNRMGSLYVTSAGLADYTHTRGELVERANDLFAVVRNGAVRVEVHQRYPLAEAARAHRDLEARRTLGSSILLP